jgi:hypothetical protein
MKKLLENTVVLIFEIICLGLAIVWYVKTKEIEPLISIIVFGAAILISLIFKLSNQNSENDDTPGSVKKNNFSNTGKMKIKGDLKIGDQTKINTK